MGSKAKIAKHIIPILIENIQLDQYFVELFCGGCNLTDKINHPLIIANDINKPLIDMWISLQNGWEPPKWTSKDEYIFIRDNQDFFPGELVGWTCFGCSYSGKPFSGFAGEHTPETGVLRNYQTETYNYILKQREKLKRVKFINKTYDQVLLPPKSRVYLDPPYKGTTGYRVKFNHETFYNYCREQVKNDHELFISEYQMPDDFISIWSGTIRSSLSANGLYGGSKKTIEKLFIHESQFDNFCNTIL
jgi:DNA adenine methylase